MGIEILGFDPVTEMEDAVADSGLDSRFPAAATGEKEQGGQEEEQGVPKRVQRGGAERNCQERKRGWVEGWMRGRLEEVFLNRRSPR